MDKNVALRATQFHVVKYLPLAMVCPCSLRAYVSHQRARRVGDEPHALAKVTTDGPRVMLC